MKRYWFEFCEGNLPFGVRIGCGVTAYNYDDALFLLSKKVFNNAAPPEIKNMIENVDISTLDDGHVLPNMSSPNLRGIWFPLGYT